MKTRTFESAHFRLVTALSASAAMCLSIASTHAGLPASDAAARVDVLLEQELPASGSSADGSSSTGTIDDEAFLRRLYLDLVGQPPTPEEMTAFVLDPAADKRSRAMNRCLQDDRFGENWGRYWRDVFLYRRSDERALITSVSVVEYLAEQFNRGTAWDELAR